MRLGFFSRGGAGSTRRGKSQSSRSVSRSSSCRQTNSAPTGAKRRRANSASSARTM